MKIIFIVYSQATDYDVIAALKRTGIKAYTKIEKAFGEGVETDPKLHTHTWPGENNVLFIALNDDEDAAVVLDQVRTLKKEHPRSGMKAFVLPLEDMV